MDIAEAALDAAEAVAQAALVAGVWLADRLADMLNIETVELTASLRDITDGGPFTIRCNLAILGCV